MGHPGRFTAGVRPAVDRHVAKECRGKRKANATLRADSRRANPLEPRQRYWSLMGFGTPGMSPPTQRGSDRREDFRA